MKHTLNIMYLQALYILFAYLVRDSNDDYFWSQDV